MTKTEVATYLEIITIEGEGENQKEQRRRYEIKRKTVDLTKLEDVSDGEEEGK